MANDILKYTSRDYESIKKDLTDAISTLSDTWTSRDDGDPGIVLVKLMSALGDMLSFNMDKQALEYYGPTVTQRKNAARVFELTGYTMHWYRTAMTTLSLTNRASMPEFVYMYKRIIDGESPVDVYYDYRVAYTSNNSISCPPEGEPLFSEQTSRFTLNLGGESEEPIEPDKTSAQFIENANNWFSESAKTVYKYWQHDNAVGLHTFVEDPNKTLGVYSNGASSTMYSLIPTNEEPTIIDVSTREYSPQIVLLPYETVEVPAIQGYLCSTSFTNVQLKNNRFYLPETQIDEDCIFLAYVTVDDNTTQEKFVFFRKTDNLLKITEFKDSNGKTIIYFQFGVDEFDYPYIELASYWRSVITEDSVKFMLYYIKTQGKYGNITQNFLTSIDTNESIEVSVENIENTEYSVNADGEYISKPGYNPQTASDAYLDSLNYIMTYNTLVTIYDFSRFLKRQNGVSNGYACDAQYADDTNEEILKTCSSYTEQQLRDILGSNIPDGKTYSDLVNYLYGIRKIVYNYKQAYITASNVDMANPQADFVNYSINLYPIWNNFETVDSTGKQIATYTNLDDNMNILPYYLYKINTEASVGSSDSDKYSIETALNNAISSTKIVNVLPNYTACRVFRWRCCGTLHLTQSVSQIDAYNIIKSVVNNLSVKYAPNNMEFGKKITYMDVIDTVVSSDSRIRYFDAGIGNKNLIDFENNLPSGSNCFNIEAYFNPESIMQYVQTFEEITNQDSVYSNMICVDPMYIQANI